MSRGVLFFALAGAIATSVAGAPSVQVLPAPNANADPAQKIVCRNVNSTGSRLSRERECKTRAQWDHETDATRDGIERAAQRAGGTPDMNDPGSLQPH